MMQNGKILYRIVVEGSSEFNYIQKLNIFLRDNEFGFTFATYNLKGVFPSKKDTEKNSYKRIRIFLKDEVIPNYENKDRLLIWLDDDVFKRGQLDKSKLESDLTKFNTKTRKIVFLYNYENFEDFLIMHLSEDKFNKWHQICAANNHFNNPMIADEYEDKIRKNIITNYKKAIIPDEIEINKETILNLKNRQSNNNCQIKSDFIKHIYNNF